MAKPARNLVIPLAVLGSTMFWARPGCATPAAAAIPRPAAAIASHASQNNAPLGVNLEGLADWMHTPMFVDAMKTARAFGPPDTPWTGGIPTDKNGWPTADFGSCIITDLPHMGGVYHLSFTGRADVSPVACAAQVQNVAYDAPANRTTADVLVPDNATQLMLSFRNTNGGDRDIRLIRPGYAANTDQTFTDAFLQAIKPYSTLRLMDYLSSNGTPVVHWDDRTQPDDALYDVGKGGPWEPMIALANETGKDVWINVPYQADDDYVRNLATLFKSSLHPGRKIYLEYSNEVWNNSFPQFTYDRQAADVEARDPASVLNIRVSPDDDPLNETYRAWKRIPERLIEIARIWREIYGPARYAATIRPVLASQLGYTFVLQEQLNFVQKVYGPPAENLYGIAGAPYFNMMGDESKTGLTTDQVLDDLGRSVDGYADHGLEPYGLLAAKYGLKLLGYEGGVDVGQGEQSLDAKAAAQMDPRMKPLLMRYLDAWYANGGDLFMYFTLCSAWNKWGFWGLTDDLSRTTPKTEAAVEVASTVRPAVTAGIPIPGTIDGTDYALSRWGRYAPDTGAISIGPDDFRDYLLNAAIPEHDTITIYFSDPSQRAVVSVNDGPAKICSSGDGFVSSLKSGLNDLHVECYGAAVSITRIRIEP